MDKEEIKQKLKEMIVRRMSLKISPEEIQDDLPLFRHPTESGLDLDSVEALELVVGIEEVFDVHVEEGDYAEEFYSINTVADFVTELLKVEA